MLACVLWMSMRAMSSLTKVGRSWRLGPFSPTRYRQFYFHHGQKLCFRGYMTTHLLRPYFARWKEEWSTKRERSLSLWSVHSFSLTALLVFSTPTTLIINHSLVFACSLSHNIMVCVCRFILYFGFAFCSLIVPLEVRSSSVFRCSIPESWSRPRRDADF